MKKNHKRIALLLLTLIVPAFMVTAAMRNWNWKSYKLKFKLHSSMNVSKSTGYDFIAKGRGIVVRIKPYLKRRRGVGAKQVAKYGYSTYRIVKRKRVIQRQRMDSRRYMIYGTGRINGRKVYWGVFGVKSTTSRRAVYVRTWWYARGRHAARNKNLSYKIARSVYFHR